MGEYIFVLLLFTLYFQCIICKKSNLCFAIVGDIGGLPYAPFQARGQVAVAKLLAKVTSRLKCQFIVGVGDNFYFDGVSDVNDPRFKLTFERTYSDKSLNIPWFMIAGNHDHKRNVSAQIAYTKVSKKWNFPHFYYSKILPIPDSDKKLQLVMIDTEMLCNYNSKKGAPPPQVQWKWIKDQLKTSTADYLIVAGHHPVYSAGSHGSNFCLVDRLKPLLEKNEVTAYFSGHDHNLQHIKEMDSSVHYFISGSGNFVDGRMPNRRTLPRYSLKFDHGLINGFITACASKDNMQIYINNVEPRKLYQIKIAPRVIINNIAKRTEPKIKVFNKMPLLNVKTMNTPHNLTEAASFHTMQSKHQQVLYNIQNGNLQDNNRIIRNDKQSTYIHDVNKMDRHQLLKKDTQVSYYTNPFLYQLYPFRVTSYFQSPFVNPYYGYKPNGVFLLQNEAHPKEYIKKPKKKTADSSNSMWRFLNTPLKVLSTFLKLNKKGG